MPKLSKPTFIGIDPGKQGGIAVRTGSNITSIKMPATEADLWDYFKLLTQSNNFVQFCVLEKVWSMPGEGHAGAFTFGKGFGALCMGLIAANIPHELSTPANWLKYLQIPNRKKTESKTQWKNRLKAEAQRLHPEHKVTLWNADALLICEYARRKYNKEMK